MGAISRPVQSRLPVVAFKPGGDVDARIKQKLHDIGSPELTGPREPVEPLCFSCVGPQCSVWVEELFDEIESADSSSRLEVERRATHRKMHGRLSSPVCETP